LCTKSTVPVHRFTSDFHSYNVNPASHVKWLADHLIFKLSWSEKNNIVWQFSLRFFFMLFIFRLPSFIKSDDTRNELNPASVNPCRHVCVKIVFLKIRGIDFEHYRCLPLLWLNKKARYFLQSCYRQQYSNKRIK